MVCTLTVFKLKLICFRFRRFLKKSGGKKVKGFGNVDTTDLCVLQTLKLEFICMQKIDT